MSKNPFKRGKPRYPYDDPHLNSNSSKRILRIAIPAIVGVIIVAILIVSGVKIVDAGVAVVPALAGARVVTHRVGLRPVRDQVRLEEEERGGGRIIHNYGHGGGGVTLSWGCAREVTDLALAH